MSKFIEVTTKDDVKYLINRESIAFIKPIKRQTPVEKSDIFFNNKDSGISVKEDYEELKILIGE
jgi:hypothetical protein